MTTDATNQAFLRWANQHWQKVGTFLIGAFGFVHEVLFVQPPNERPFLIAGSMALMGLPFLFAGENMIRRRNGNGSESR